MLDPTKIIVRPYVSEKTMRLIEKENKLVFVVDRKANKPTIKEAIEKLYDVKVAEINTEITSKGLKKAYVKLKTEYKASDIATKIGVI